MLDWASLSPESPLPPSANGLKVSDHESGNPFQHLMLWDLNDAQVRTVVHRDSAGYRRS